MPRIFAVVVEVLEVVAVAALPAITPPVPATAAEELSSMPLARMLSFPVRLPLAPVPRDAVVLPLALALATLAPAA